MLYNYWYIFWIFDCRHFPAFSSYLLLVLPLVRQPVMDKPKENIVISRTAKPENRSSFYILCKENTKYADLKVKQLPIRMVKLETNNYFSVESIRIL